MGDLVITGAKLCDYPDYYDIRCGETDIYWMGHTGPPDYDNLKKIFMERMADKPFCGIGDKRIYMIKTEGTRIGFVMLSINCDGIEMGISIKEVYQGAGYGTRTVQLASSEAKKYGNLVYARIRDDNIASQKVFLNNNFVMTDEYEVIQYPIVGNVKFRKYLLNLRSNQL